jgi:uncharacterized protein (DUF1501 family)
MLSRRALLGAGALGAATFARPARASVSAEDLKFVFVVIFRGWDVTRVYAPEFDNPVVAMEADAEATTVGDLTWVDHPDRPSVSEFFQTWGSRSVIVNGIENPSLSHVECLRRVMTGFSASTSEDWPARIAYAARDRYPLPHVVVNGPNYPGSHGGYVTRIGATAWVEELLDASLLERDDAGVRALTTAGRSAVDAAVKRLSHWRHQAALTNRDRQLTRAHTTSLSRLATLESRAGDLSWPDSTGMDDQTALAVDLLAQDLSRCITVAHDFSEWDSHADNDDRQSSMFGDLYTRLGTLMTRLSETAGPAGGTLADETVVVVLSEMGRTPYLNGGDGKDHWPHTSALLVGPNLAGGRVVGGFDELFTGSPIDFTTGEVTKSGELMGMPELGATLLELAGVEQDDLGEVVRGILA